MAVTELDVQREYKLALSRGKTPEMVSAAQAADKASHAELNELRARTENCECFDCTMKKPGWAVLPHGVFVCIDCAQVHRRLGRHVSQVKAVNTGTYLWFPHELAVMRAVGNAVAARAYSAAPQKLPANANPDEKLARAKAKYEDHQWGPPNFEAAPRHPAQDATPLARSDAQRLRNSATRDARGNAATRKRCDAVSLVARPGRENTMPIDDLISMDDELPAWQPAWPTASVLGVQNSAPSAQHAQHATPQKLVSCEHEKKKAAVMASFNSVHGHGGVPMMAHDSQSFFVQFGL